MEQALTLAREALYLALLTSAPPVLTAMAASLLMSLLQSATQLHDPVLPFAPRLLAAVGALVLTAPWILAQLLHFTAVVFESIIYVS